MQSTQDGLVLTLEDIMHTGSPPPHSQPQLPTKTPPSLMPSGHTFLAQESNALLPPLDSPDRIPSVPATDMQSIRSRLRELGFLDSTTSSKSSTEKELFDMVLRLLPLDSPASGYTDQLSIQADTISGLVHQRTFLLKQKEEEQDRWDAERESWRRTTEVLKSKRSATGEAHQLNEESQRVVAFMESDNKVLKHKLAESQQRLTLLESELNRLRPLLLMQPIATSSYIFNTPTQAPQQPPKLVPPKRKTRRDKAIEADTRAVGERADTNQDGEERIEGHTSTTAADAEPVAGQTKGQQPEEISQASSSRSQHYRLLKDRELQAQQSQHAQAQHPMSKRAARLASRATSSAHISLLSDARNECLLAAMRKFGRVKAGLQAGLLKERELVLEKGKGVATGKEKETDGVDVDATPVGKVTGEKEAKRRSRKQNIGQERAEASGSGAGGSILPFPQTPQAGPSKPPGTTSPFPKTPRRGSASAIHPPPIHPHIVPHPLPTNQLHPPVPQYIQAPQAHAQLPGPIPHPAHPGHPTHQFVYINPVQPGGRGYMQPMQVTTAPNGMPLFMPVWSTPAHHAPTTGTTASLATPTRATGSNTPLTSRRAAEKAPASTGRGSTGRKRRAAKRKEPLDAGEPQGATPLDSLVSAARTLMVDEDAGSRGGGDADEADNGGSDEGRATDDADDRSLLGTQNAHSTVVPVTVMSMATMTTVPRRRRRAGTGTSGAAAAETGSPVPKRRKVGNQHSMPSSLHPSALLTQASSHSHHLRTSLRQSVGGPPTASGGTVDLEPSTPAATPMRDNQLGRARSALDVLADTAQEQERRPPIEPPTGTSSSQARTATTTARSSIVPLAQRGHPPNLSHSSPHLDSRSGVDYTNGSNDPGEGSDPEHSTDELNRPAQHHVPKTGQSYYSSQPLYQHQYVPHSSSPAPPSPALDTSPSHMSSQKTVETPEVTADTTGSQRSEDTVVGLAPLRDVSDLKSVGSLSPTPAPTDVLEDMEPLVDPSSATEPVSLGTTFNSPTRSVSRDRDDKEVPPNSEVNSAAVALSDPGQDPNQGHQIQAENHDQDPDEHERSADIDPEGDLDADAEGDIDAEEDTEDLAGETIPVRDPPSVETIHLPPGDVFVSPQSTASPGHT